MNRKFLIASLLILNIFNIFSTEASPLEGGHLGIRLGRLDFSSSYFAGLDMDKMAWTGQNGNGSFITTLILDHMLRFNYFFLGFFGEAGYHNPQLLMGEDTDIINAMLDRGIGKVLYNLGTSLGFGGDNWHLSYRIGAGFHSANKVSVGKLLEGTGTLTDTFQSIPLINSYGLLQGVVLSIALGNHMSLSFCFNYVMFSATKDLIGKLDELVEAKGWKEDSNEFNYLVSPLKKGLDIFETSVVLSIRTW